MVPPHHHLVLEFIARTTDSFHGLGLLRARRCESVVFFDAVKDYLFAEEIRLAFLGRVTFSFLTVIDLRGLIRILSLMIVPANSLIDILFEDFLILDEIFAFDLR